MTGFFFCKSDADFPREGVEANKVKCIACRKTIDQLELLEIFRNSKAIALVLQHSTYNIFSQIAIIFCLNDRSNCINCQWRGLSVTASLNSSSSQYTTFALWAMVIMMMLVCSNVYLRFRHCDTSTFHHALRVSTFFFAFNGKK